MNEGFANLLALSQEDTNPSAENILQKTCLPQSTEGTTALKTDILNADSRSLTTDSCTSNSTEDFVTVILHVLSDWVLSCYVLDTSPLSLAHTASNLSAHLTSVIQKWSVKD